MFKKTCIKKNCPFQQNYLYLPKAIYLPEFLQCKNKSYLKIGKIYHNSK